EPGRVGEGLEDLLGEQLLEVTARDVQPPAVQNAGADAEVLPDQMIERYSARGEVATVLERGELDAVITQQRVERLRLDQRHLTIDVMLFRVCAQPRRITVAVYPDARGQVRLDERPHGCLRLLGNVDVRQRALP